MKRSAFSRAVWIALPPTLLTYANVVVFTNLGTWIYFMVVFGILFGAFTTIVALNEPGLALGGRWLCPQRLTVFGDSGSVLVRSGRGTRDLSWLRTRHGDRLGIPHCSSPGD